MDVSDWVALLLPVAAASGWYAAGKHYTRKYLTNFRHPLTQAYRRGLNYLLDEKTDKAIDAVTRILEQESEPMETHLVLGNLFRRRGEVEKAIEIHEKLSKEANLTPAQTARANFELGLDHMRAGLLDRAERIFVSLRETKSHGKPALQQLLQLYQQQKDWQKAIACVLELRGISKPRHGETAAHFLCELAEEAMVQHRLKDARDYLTRALQDDPSCVRASIVRGRLELVNGELLQSLQTFKAVEAQNPVFLPVVLPMICACWERQGNERELMQYLDQIHQEFGIVSAAVLRSERLKRTQGVEAAIDYLLPILEAHPESTAITRALALLSEDSRYGSGKLRRLCTLLETLAEGSQQFRCDHCGFGLSELYWRCPSCQHWDSVTPTESFNISSLLPNGEDDIKIR